MTLEKETAALQKLAALYPAEYSQLQENKFNAKDQIILLRAVDLGVGSLEELMQVYKAQGEKGLGTYQAKQQATVQKNGAKSAAPAIDGKVLERLKQVSEQTGVPLDQLTEQFIAARNLSKQVLVERE